MQAGFSLQSELSDVFWGLLALVGSLPSVRRIVGRVQPWT